MKNFLFIAGLLFVHSCLAQNIGIGTTNPSQKLDVNGTVKTKNLMLTGTGSKSDFLKKGAGDSIVFQKGHHGLGLNYIIAVEGLYPSQSNGSYPDIILGEIRLFAGTYAPAGFLFCHGQVIDISQNTQLFSIIGTMYGGDGQTTFALPDLRAAVPVGAGNKTPEPSWELGERSQ